MKRQDCFIGLGDFKQKDPRYSEPPFLDLTCFVNPHLILTIGQNICCVEFIAFKRVLCIYQRDNSHEDHLI